MKQIPRWPCAVLLIGAVTLAGCDLVKKVAEGDDATTKSSTAAAADPGGLPQECIDYLEVLECANAKSDPASAKAQTDAARTGFKTLAASGGAAAAKKNCADLMAGSQAGFAQLGCTKGAATAATAAKAGRPNPASPTAAPKPTAAPNATAAPKATVAATTSSSGNAASATPAPKAAGTAAGATATTGKGRCPKGSLRSKEGRCSVPTCTSDDDCAPHPCSIVRDGVRACSGSIDLIDDSEF